MASSPTPAQNAAVMPDNTNGHDGSGRTSQPTEVVATQRQEPTNGAVHYGCLNFLSTESDRLWQEGVGGKPLGLQQQVAELRKIADTRDRRNGSCIDGSKISDETLLSMVLRSRREPRANARSAAKSTHAAVRALTHQELKTAVENSPGDLVEGLIPEKSVNIAVGDSGLGKTALMVQLGLSVASGKPFLNPRASQPAPVLYVDYENGQAQFSNLLDTIGGYLGLSETPDDFRLLHQPASPGEVIAAVKQFHPKLVIVDALRGFEPKMETKNETASSWLTHLHKVAEENSAAFLFLHHLRKKDLNNPPPPLAMSNPMEWLLQASGARALINQTDVRLAIDEFKVGDAALIMKGHYKLRGGIGPIQIARVYDETGDPVGYRRLIGVDLLPAEQRDVYAKLPDPFTFKQAQHTSGKGPKTVAEWLKEWEGGAGVVHKSGKPRTKDVRYHKVKHK